MTFFLHFFKIFKSFQVGLVISITLLTVFVLAGSSYAQTDDETETEQDSEDFLEDEADYSDDSEEIYYESTEDIAVDDVQLDDLKSYEKLIFEVPACTEQYCDIYESLSMLSDQIHSLISQYQELFGKEEGDELALDVTFGYASTSDQEKTDDSQLIVEIRLEDLSSDSDSESSYPSSLHFDKKYQDDSESYFSYYDHLYYLEKRFDKKYKKLSYKLKYLYKMLGVVTGDCIYDEEDSTISCPKSYLKKFYHKHKKRSYGYDKMQDESINKPFDYDKIPRLKDFMGTGIKGPDFKDPYFIDPDFKEPSFKDPDFQLTE